jgi:hypothetical protein
MVGLQSLGVKSQGAQKFKGALSARKIYGCVGRNIVGETIGQPKDSFHWKLPILVGNDQTTGLRSGARRIQKCVASLAHMMSLYRSPIHFRGPIYQPDMLQARLG